MLSVFFGFFLWSTILDDKNKQDGRCCQSDEVTTLLKKKKQNKTWGSLGSPKQKGRVKVIAVTWFQVFT